MGTDAQRERALKLAERLLEITPETDEGLFRRASQLRDRLRTPMSMVLEKVPGDTVVDKCKRLGITRQNYYCWLKGEYRPNMKQSKKLAAITGFDADDIRGRG